MRDRSLSRDRDGSRGGSRGGSTFREGSRDVFRDGSRGGRSMSRDRSRSIPPVYSDDEDYGNGSARRGPPGTGGGTMAVRR